MSMQITNIILYSISLLISTLILCVSTYVLLIMVLRRATFREQRIDYLLYANTYITLFFLSFFFIDMFAYSIYGQIYSDSSFDGWWCRVKAYFTYICGCTFFHSFLLQAVYRLCRTLYRTQIKFQSFRLYVILSFVIWILVFVELLPSLLIGDVEYVHNDYHCQFAITNIRGSLTVCLIGFTLPFTLTVSCYAWTMYHIRKQSTALTSINQQASIHRDIIILKRLSILLTFVTVTAAPHLFLPIVYAVTQHLPFWLVSMEWLLTTCGVLSVMVIQVFVSTHLKSLLIGLNHVEPIAAIVLR